MTGLFQNLLLGLRVLADELSWVAVRAMREMEMRQLRKRLADERRTLEKLGATGPEDEVELCRRQIDFLSEELDFLASEMQAKRADMLARRAARFELDAS